MLGVQYPEIKRDRGIFERGDHQFEATFDGFKARSVICPIEPTSETAEFQAEPSEPLSPQSTPGAGWGVSRP